MEFLDIVNENDEVIGKASKEEIYENRLTHRIVHVFVFNDKGEMALHVRSKDSLFCPLYWDTAASGHVQSGESYEEAALRELDEEVGISAGVDLVFKDIYEYTGEYDDVSINKRGIRKGLKKILATLKAVHNGPFKINPEEVEKAEFFSLEKIQEMINNGEKFHPELLFILNKHFDIKAD